MKNFIEFLLSDSIAWPNYSVESN